MAKQNTEGSHATLEAKVDAANVTTLLIFYATWLIVAAAAIVGLTWSLPEAERTAFANIGLGILVANAVLVTGMGIFFFPKLMNLASVRDVKDVEEAARLAVRSVSQIQGVDPKKLPAEVRDWMNRTP